MNAIDFEAILAIFLIGSMIAGVVAYLVKKAIKKLQSLYAERYEQILLQEISINKRVRQ